jgi:hypothetical protein
MVETGRPARAEVGVDPLEVKGVGVGEDQQRCQDKAGVAHAVDDEGFHAGGGFLVVLVPEADQQVGSQAHPFPAGEEHDHVLAQDQHEHEEQKQVEIGEVARLALVMGHVPHGVEVDQGTDPGDHQAHDGGDLVQVEGHVNLQRIQGYPGVEGFS